MLNADRGLWRVTVGKSMKLSVVININTSKKGKRSSLKFSVIAKEATQDKLQMEK